jgi:hypothetical protein
MKRLFSLALLALFALTLPAVAQDKGLAKERMQREMIAPEKKAPGLKDAPKLPSFKRDPSTLPGGNPLKAGQPKLPKSYGGNVDPGKPDLDRDRPFAERKTHDVKKSDSSSKAEKPRYHSTSKSNLTGEAATKFDAPDKAKEIEKKAGIQDPTKSHSKAKSEMKAKLVDPTQKEKAELKHNQTTSTRDPVDPETAAQTTVDPEEARKLKRHEKNASVAEHNKVMSKSVGKAIDDYLDKPRVMPPGSAEAEQAKQIDKDKGYGPKK